MTILRHIQSLSQHIFDDKQHTSSSQIVAEATEPFAVPAQMTKCVVRAALLGHSP